jgi:hypothetical protein
MTTLVRQIAEKYQGSAPQKVVNAVEEAASRTGADFSQLMEKAYTESGFNPSAKSKTSSATGLFQFIDSTWLGMVKQYGAKFGLAQYASQIEMKNGKPCVANCNVKNAILNLRKNPELSALMAGVMSAQDKQYLQSNTDGPVGGTEMYLAHFMGAGGAAKFLNARDDNGSASAAQMFPREAHANKSVFYNSSTGQARTFDQVYNILARKIGGTENATANNGTDGLPLADGSETTAPASSTHAPPPSDGMPLMPVTMAQALPSSSDDGIIWDTPATGARSGFSHSSGVVAGQKLSANSILLLAQMQHQHVPGGMKSKSHYNS